MRKLLFAVVVALAGSVAQATTYRVIDLLPIMPFYGYGGARITGLNDLGHVLLYTGGWGVSASFYYDGVLVSQLIAPTGASNTRAISLSNKGVIVTDEGYMLANGKRRAIPNFGANPYGISPAKPTAINGKGQITGSAVKGIPGAPNGINSRAFLATRSAIVDLGSGTQTGYSYGYDINSAGAVVGYIEDGWDETCPLFQYNGTRAAIWDELGMIKFGSCNSAANAINDRGVVVGVNNFGARDNPPQAFILDSRGYRPISSVQSSALDINNDSEVIGWSASGFFVWNKQEMFRIIGSLFEPGSEAWNILSVVKINDSGVIAANALIGTGLPEHPILLVPIR